MTETMYRIVSNDILGRHLVAARDLKKGEVILQEHPLATGPERGSTILCCTCNKPPRDSHYKCERCSWPICGPDCAQHHFAECSLLQELKKQLPQLFNFEELTNVLMILRLLLLKSTDEARWKHVLDMETNWQAWSKSELHTQAQTTTRKLRSLFQKLCENYTSEELLHVQAALDINAYEVRMPEINVQALYGLARLVEHNCCPNTHRTIDTKQLLTLHAAEDIREGTNISVSYCDVLWPTAQRQEYLEWSKFFVCSCIRCQDPSELSSELSSLLCFKCSGPMRSCFSKPIQSCNSYFKCRDCQNSVEISKNVIEIRARNELEALEDDTEDLEIGNIKDYENWLIHWTKLDLPGLQLLQTSDIKLYPNHSLVIDCCHTLFLLYSRDDGTSNTELRRKEKLGIHLLDATAPLSAGIQKFRGTVMYELALAKITLLMKQLESKDDTDAILSINREMADEAVSSLKTSLELLQYEPLDQPEGALCTAGARQLQQLQTYLTTLIPDLTF